MTGRHGGATYTFMEADFRLVVSIAKGHQAAEVPPQDLVQEVNLSLNHAVERIDWRKGFKFSIYFTVDTLTPSDGQPDLLRPLRPLRPLRREWWCSINYRPWKGRLVWQDDRIGQSPWNGLDASSRIQKRLSC